MKNIVITGANGFVGKNLIEKLNNCNIFASVRSEPISFESKQNLQFIKMDFDHPVQSLIPIDQIDAAYYLIHGLKEQQANFEYKELKAALHFSNWAIKNKVKKIIYLSGLGQDDELSPHLRSRHVTGDILRLSGIPVTELRASIVIGAGSFSFEMIKAICQRFPFLIEHPWLKTKAQPIALSDLMNYLEQSLELKNKSQIFEIGGSEVISYFDLVHFISHKMGMEKKTIKIPNIDPVFVKKVMDYALFDFANVGFKLFESLKHETTISQDSLKSFYQCQKNLDQAVELALESSRTQYGSLAQKDVLLKMFQDKISEDVGDQLQNFRGQLAKFFK
jgi:uncharacterized protein YbjT (DUF2867 family)